MRKASQEGMSKDVVVDMDDYMVSEALVLARNTLQNDSAWEEHLYHASGSLMLSCVYGEHTVSPFYHGGK